MAPRAAESRAASLRVARSRFVLTSGFLFPQPRKTTLLVNRRATFEGSGPLTREGITAVAASGPPGAAGTGLAIMDRWVVHLAFSYIYGYRPEAVR